MLALPPARRSPSRRSSLAAHLAALALATVAATAPAIAHADDGAPLRAAGREWFDGERQSGWAWGGVGVLSLGAAASLHRFGHGSDVGRGMAYPLAGFGLLQTAIGVGALARGSGRADELDAAVARSPLEARESERRRMRTLGYAFLGIELVEAAVIVSGAAYAATRDGPDHATARGVALGFATEGGAMLLLDALAAIRASRYAGQLDAISITAGPSSHGLGLSVRAVF